MPRDIKNLVVDGFQCGKVCAVAKCNGVSEDLLGACEPCWAQARRALSMLVSGVSSKNALLTSCASVWSVRDARASIMSWYCFCDMRSCQGCLLAGTIGAASLINECLALHLRRNIRPGSLP